MLGERLLIVSGDVASGLELRTTDGTLEGTDLLADLCPGPCSPVILTVHEEDGLGIFLASTASGQPFQVWGTDFTSGALPGRSEVFARVVGPKPNGFLWPTLVKFSTSQVEVWVRQTATGEVRRYLLEGARPGFDELPGLFDRQGFTP